MRKRLGVTLLLVLMLLVAMSAVSSAQTLERVRERGRLVCGANNALLGFGYVDSAGNWSGFDIDFCRAIAAAVLGDANAVEFVALSAAARQPALQTGEVDVLIATRPRRLPARRTGPPTLSRRRFTTAKAS